MQPSVTNIIELLKKHQYLISVDIDIKKNIVFHFPDKYFSPECKSSVIKYRILHNPSRVKIVYQTLGEPSKKEIIHVPKYACVLYICFHITRICVLIYNYEPTLIQYFLNKETSNMLEFWAKYIKIIKLTSEELTKHAELSLLCSLAQEQNFSHSFFTQAKNSDILEGYKTIIELMGHEPPKIKEQKKKKNSWWSLSGRKRRK